MNLYNSNVEELTMMLNHDLYIVRAQVSLKINIILNIRWKDHEIKNETTIYSSRIE